MIAKWQKQPKAFGLFLPLGYTRESTKAILNGTTDLASRTLSVGVQHYTGVQSVQEQGWKSAGTFSTEFFRVCGVWCSPGTEESLFLLHRHVGYYKCLYSH